MVGAGRGSDLTEVIVASDEGGTWLLIVSGVSAGRVEDGVWSAAADADVGFGGVSSESIHGSFASVACTCVLSFGAGDGPGAVTTGDTYLLMGGGCSRVGMLWLKGMMSSIGRSTS